MLKIGQSQFDAFSDVADGAFAGRIAAHLRQNHPDVTVKLRSRVSSIRDLSDTALEELILKGISRSRGYGLTYENSIAAFVVLMFVIAPNFDSGSKIKRILNDSSIPADSRMQKVLEEGRDVDWMEARSRYDVQAWEESGTQGGSQ